LLFGKNPKAKKLSLRGIFYQCLKKGRNKTIKGNRPPLTNEELKKAFEKKKKVFAYNKIRY